MQRRLFSLALGGGLAAMTAGVSAKNSKGQGAHDVGAQLRQIEAASGGRLGVCILNTADGRRVGHRADERFPMCSTFKLVAAALVLQRVDRGQDTLDRPIAIERSAIVPHSPLTEPNVGGTMTMGALCEATITQSDNAAANLMLASFGGPAGLTTYVRSLGDPLTRLDRNEPGLNEAVAGDPRDTTTPATGRTSWRSSRPGTSSRPWCNRRCPEDHRQGALEREGLDHSVEVAAAGHGLGREPLQEALAGGGEAAEAGEQEAQTSCR
jgi:beta-lactamase class A